MSQRGANLFLRRAEKNQFFPRTPELIRQRRIIPAFIDAARQKDYRRGKTCERFDDRADVGALGIVVIADAVFLPPEFEPVLESREVFYRVLDRRLRDTRRL